MAFNDTVNFLKCCALVLYVSAQQQDQDCTLSAGQKSRCVEIEICTLKAVQTLLNKDFDNETCKEKNFTICCPLSENIVTPESTCAQKYLKLHHNSHKNVISSAQNSPAFTNFIVGGAQARTTEFPHMAALGFENENETLWKCGGSLISEQFILTAAHCVFPREIGDLKTVRLGDLNLKSTADDQHVQEFGVSRTFRHPKYIPPSLYNDIALVQLDTFVQITDYVRPACLQTNSFVPASSLIATGWGRVEYEGSSSDQLMKVSLDLYPNELCRQAYSSVPSRQLLNGIVDEIQICAGDTEEQKDACQGDSGGPLQFVDWNNPNLYHIVGITSFGKGCGTKTNPGVYTKVSGYISWIEQIVWPK